VNVRAETIDTVSRLERELAGSGRTDEAAALEELLAAVARPGKGLLTTGQAAGRLGITVQTVKNWIGRGTLRGIKAGTRWLVSEESVETVEGIRRTFAEAVEEGHPTPDEIAVLTKRTRRAVRTAGDDRDVA
jgi:excisionase family DNA binding protein